MTTLHDSLPQFVVVDQNGNYWRVVNRDDVGITETVYSICPTTSDNEPVEERAVYVLEAPMMTRAEKRQIRDAELEIEAAISKGERDDQLLSGRDFESWDDAREALVVLVTWANGGPKRG